MKAGYFKVAKVVRVSEISWLSFQDGTVILHTVRRGHYMRTVRPSCDPSCRLEIPLLVVSDMGQIVLYCTEINALGKTVLS